MPSRPCPRAPEALADGGVHSGLVQPPKFGELEAGDSVTVAAGRLPLAVPPVPHGL